MHRAEPFVPRTMLMLLRDGAARRQDQCPEAMNKNSPAQHNMSFLTPTDIVAPQGTAAIKVSGPEYNWPARQNDSVWVSPFSICCSSALMVKPGSISRFREV